MLRAGRSRILIFCVLAAAVFFGASMIPTGLSRFSRLLSENYRFIADEAIRRGDYPTAIAIAQRRIRQFSYDFEAHYVLADALVRSGKPLEAAAVMKEILRKVPAVRSKNVLATGYDQGRTYANLAEYLWEGAKYFEAGEMLRAALDSGISLTPEDADRRFNPSNGPAEARIAAARIANKMNDEELFTELVNSELSGPAEVAIPMTVLKSEWLELRQRSIGAAESVLSATLALNPDSPLAGEALAAFYQRRGHQARADELRTSVAATTGSRAIGPGLFDLPVGATVTTGSLSIGRNGTATAEVNTGVYRVTSLLLDAKGTPALGMYPVVIVRANGEELTRLYLDGLQPHAVDFGAWIAGAPKTVRLELEFINDVYDPLTRADRNAIFYQVLLH